MSGRPRNDAERAAKRELENRRSIERSRALNEIAPIPECEDLSFREELERDPARWLSTILPEIFFADFTPTQERFIDLVWSAIVEGSWRNIEAYRGIGKTSILSGLLLKALLEGKVRHAVYCTAEGGASTVQASYWFAAALFDDYNARGEDARLLTRLYPEVGYPLQRREGRAQRPLTCNGVPLKIEMKSDRIVLPNVPGSRCAGSLLRFTSISSGGLRGANHTIPGAGSFRVQCVMLDDVQNDATARSAVEVDSIISTIQKSIRGLAGRRADGTRESLTVLSAITQNQPGDVAERLIEEIPEFGTLVLPFVTSLPDNFDEWKRYKAFREETLRKNPNDVAGARRRLAEYYKQNRESLARNVAVDDPRQRETWQVDAVHYALDFWSASEPSFWCELQNDARRAAAESGSGLSALDVARKTRVDANGVALARYVIPDGADIVVAHIDAGEHYLNYQVSAYSKDFTLAHVVDFGVFPDQPLGVASKKTFAVDLQDVYTRGDKFDRLQAAVLDLLQKIFKQQYFDESGRELDVDVATQFEQHARPRGQRARNFAALALCGVDCGDAEMEAAIWGAIDRFHTIDGGRYLGRAIPAYGDAARARLMRYYPLRPGEWRRSKRYGFPLDWIENSEDKVQLTRTFPNVYAWLKYDANTAKTRRDAAWRLPAGRPGAASIFNRLDCDSDEAYNMFCIQQTAETFTTSRRSGLLYNVWQMKRPRVADNEFLDTDAACRALAEYVGGEVADESNAPIKKPRAYTRREL